MAALVKRNAKAIERQMRNQGYNDGRAGRAPRCPDSPDYMASWRRGTEAIAKEAQQHGP